MNAYTRRTEFAKHSTVALALWVSICDLVHDLETVFIMP